MQDNTRPSNDARGTRENSAPFEGYGHPRFTTVPDLFLDHQMQHLSGSAVKVMLYVFRRTYGWKKDEDAISYQQFLKGIWNRDGEQVDEGAGVSERSLSSALEELEQQGLIFRHRLFGADGSKLTTVYELNIDGQPRFKPKNPNIFMSPPPTAKIADTPPSAIFADTPTAKIADTPTAKNTVTINKDSQHTKIQHTQQPTADKEDKGANALCVTDTGNTYPISDEVNISEGKTQPKKRIRNPQDAATGRRGGDSTSDRTSTFKPIKTPVHGLQGQIAQRLRQVRIAATQAGKLSAQIVATGRDLDYVERWIAFVERENKTNPAGFLVRVLSDLAEPPQSAQAHTDLNAEKYVTGKYADIFNRQPPDGDRSPTNT